MTDNPILEPPPLPHLAGLATAARDLDDYRLAEHLSVAVAHRDVAAAHGYPGIASTWNEAAMVLADVRDERMRTRREFDRLAAQLLGIVGRPMTPEEVMDAWPDDPPEVPC